MKNNKQSGLFWRMASIIGAVLFLIFISRWAAARITKRRKMTLFGGVAILALAFVSFNVQGKYNDVLTVPAYLSDNTVKMATYQPTFHNALYWPFQSCYEGSCSGYHRTLPVGWPGDTTDSETIRSIGAESILYGDTGLNLYSEGTSADPAVMAQLDWAASVGMKVNMWDSVTDYYIRWGTYYSLPQIQIHINRVVELYASHSGLGGYDVAGEPEGWGASPIQREGMYARLGQVTALYKAADPNHRVYAGTASAAKMRFCREGRPTEWANSGFDSLRGGGALIDENSQEFQTNIENRIDLLDVDYLCTENYGIPFGFSLAANYWAGDSITPAETRMYIYLLLAHGGQGLEWFPYGTEGGLVWDNQAPDYTLNFSNWLPAMQGGLIYKDSQFKKPPGSSNVHYAVDTLEKHSGNYSARMDFSGVAGYNFNLRLFPPGDVSATWPPNFRGLKANTSYTMKGWVKIDGDADIQLKAIGPMIAGDGSDVNYAYSENLRGTHDWTEITKSFTTGATTGLFTFGPYSNSASTGSVWFDDFSLIETADPTQRNLAAKFNPGFETVTGADRTPREPLYSAVRTLNSELATLGPLMVSLKRISAFDDQKVPTKGLVNSVSSSVPVGQPRVEIGVFATADSNADYYLAVVNRNINSAATVNLVVNSAANLSLTDALTGASQNAVSNGTTASTVISLPAGGGKIFHLTGIKYNPPQKTLVYSEDFDDGAAQGWTMTGGTWTYVNDNDGKVLDVRDSSGLAYALDRAHVYDDLEYSGKVKIMSDHDMSYGVSPIDITFRKDPNDPSPGNNKYDMRITLDPGAESSVGVVELGRRDTGSTTWFCLLTDENFARGDRYVDFKIRAYGNRIEGYFDGTKYIDCIDNSGLGFSSGYIGLRVSAGAHLRFDDLQVYSLTAASSSCTENWGCSDWSACVNSLQTRTCVDANSCGTETTKPATSQACLPPCESNFQCDDWSVCSSQGGQTRACVDINSCDPPGVSPPTTQSCTYVCQTNWQCSAWSVCSNSQQVRGCIDANNCNIFSGKPAESQSCINPPRSGGGGGGSGPAISGCEERWVCSDWTNCSGGTQMRACTDSNQCGTVLNKPLLSQSCQAACKPFKVCQEWSACINGSQIRDCQDVSSCGATADTTLTRDCLSDTAADIISPETYISQAAVQGDTASILVYASDNQTPSASLKLFCRVDRTEETQCPTGQRVILRNLANGRHIIHISSLDAAGNKDLTPAEAIITVTNLQQIITIPKSGPSLVRIFDNLGRLLSQFYAFAAWHKWGGSVGVIYTNQGQEIVAAAGRGGPPEVKLFTKEGNLLSSFMAYPDNFRGGVNVAVADLNGDGLQEIITAPASGTGPWLRVFKTDGTLVGEGLAGDKDFRGGLNIAAGTLDNSGTDKLVVAAASNGTGEISIYSLKDGILAQDKIVKLEVVTATAGISVAISQVTGEEPQIIASVTEGSKTPEIYVYAATLDYVGKILAGDAKFTGGLTVGSGGLRSEAGAKEIISAIYSQARCRITLYSPGENLKNLQPVRTFAPYGWSRFSINAVIGALY
ncbi:MAG: family 16 glycoside hydrolase [Candidatus Komeilibacteria bacterium]